MPICPNRHRDSAALAFAAIATLMIGFLDSPTLITSTAPSAPASHETEPALGGLLDADMAQAAGAWWLDERQPSTKLSFAPEYQRLVWVVEGHEQSVLLDAKTGEALAFAYD